MTYFLAFFDVGGGFVFSMALNTSSNFKGASDSRSVLRVAIFFFVRFRTYSLSAPSGQPLVLLHQTIKLAGQPIPSNALPVSQPLALNLFNRNFHALAIG